MPPAKKSDGGGAKRSRVSGSGSGASSQKIAKRRRTASSGGASPRLMRQLANLPPAEQRARLLELLAADLSGGALSDDEEGRVDADWTMPELDDDGRTASVGQSLCFEHRACEVTTSAEARTELLKACHLVFALDGSSWMPCTASPRCLPERLAAAVFAHHTAGLSACSDFDPARSGAEWWAQVRQQGHREEAVQFHWDTDESAVEQRRINVHPHLSTVTYLTDCGAPTLILDRRNPRSVESGSVAAACYGPIRRGLLSYPRIGKHIVFDGQLLHGTVPLGAPADSDEQKAERAVERVTFLVNVWLNHRPSHCRPVPDSLAARLGDSSLQVDLTPCTEPSCAPVAGASKSPEEGAMRSFETTFGRQEPHDHHLRVLLPSRSCDTLVLEWEAGLAELRGASPGTARTREAKPSSVRAPCEDAEPASG
eukprot:gnl/TRDRNA2_/TRDRNA2_81142_c0_seq1.p1 gnl/TRDRNA2_/TRDRNA2_81142_c0~~gnl/TRDRNA2_/TRDRNA2_81142_c0_seq1.p1  ORF type:complete len:453 (-),score=64.97 gnl/TRDRNA2_/TRDRNA2_81142_c0_seq1:16-1293(-)